MKILRIDREAAEWPQSAVAALESNEAAPAAVIPARLVADSAIVRNNRPVFVPDFAREGWVVEVRPAFHVGRLGKFISRRFAGRYVESFSLVACLCPADISSPDALTDSFDGAIVVGETLPLPDGPVISVKAGYSPLPVKSGGIKNGMQSVEIKDAVVNFGDLHVEDTVALMSRYATLKSGDIILPASIGIRFPVKLDYSLSASVNGAEGLLLRLK